MTATRPRRTDRLEAARLAGAFAFAAALTFLAWIAFGTSHSRIVDGDLIAGPAEVRR